MSKFLKNIEFSQALNLATLVDYQEGRIISLTMVQNSGLSMTLFAFGSGEGVSSHATPGDALLYVLDGEAEVTIAGTASNVKTGEVIVMPANVPHGVEARQNFKMLLVVVKK